MTSYIFICAAFCAAAIFFSNRKFREERAESFVLWAGLLLLAGLVLRLFLGYNSEGFSVDMNTFKGWAYKVAQVGLKDIYKQDMFLDYPPGYLYVLLFLEKLRQLFALPTESQVYTLIMKLPSIAADMLCAALILYGGRVRLGDRGAIMAAAMYLFCPAVFVNSAQWGQADSFCTMILLASVLMLYGEKYLPAGLLYGLSIICKPQMLTFAPLYIFFAIKQKKWAGLGIGVVSAVAAILLVAAPFNDKAFDYGWLIEKYKSTMDYYNYFSVNACNFWTLIGLNWRNLDAVGETANFLLTVGAPVLATGACGALIFLTKRKDAVFAAVPVLMGIVYMFAVKMHERYLFPAFLFILLGYMFTCDKRLLRAYGIMAGANYINVSFMLLTFREKGNNYDPNATPFKVMSFLQLAALCYLLWVCYRVYIKGELREAAVLAGTGGKEAVSVSSGKAGKKNKGQKVKVQAAQNLGIAPEERRMLRLDWIIMAGITIIYAFVGFWELGDRQLPLTNWTPEVGESVVLHADTTCNYLYYLPGLAPDDDHYAGKIGSKMKIESSEDGVNWYDCGETKERSHVFSWDSKWLDYPGSYVRLTPLEMSSGRVVISEAALIPADRDMVPEITAEGAGAEALVDEHQMVPLHRTYKNSSYFDEIYHARTAYEHILELEPYENTHPPLGKHIISLGIRMFGMNPFGWRFMGTLFGVLLLPALYHLIKNLFGKTWLCGLGTLLFALDFMHFSQTRIATIDTYSVFFLILMYDAMTSFLHKDILKASMKELLIPLGLSGIFMGLGVASKWTAAYGAVGLAVLYFAKLFAAYRYEVKGHRSTAAISRRCMVLCGWCCLLFIAIPFGIYFCAFLPMTTLPHNSGKALWAFGNYQKTMFNYHSKLVAEHDFASPWYEWPLDARPIWFFGGTSPDGLYSHISSMGNPLLWWSFIPAFIFSVWRWVKEKSMACGVALIGFLSAYLPWVLVPRLTFIYHYFTAVPFLILALLAVFQWMSENGPMSRPVQIGDKLVLKLNWAQMALGAFALVCLVLFVVYFPVISGMPVAREYNKGLALFDSWYFG